MRRARSDAGSFYLDDPRCAFRNVSCALHALPILLSPLGDGNALDLVRAAQIGKI
ncbi:MAG TPA: hypothetical protein VF304_13370 [Casimicrobiaceae bacterium]